jgi:hypothetical protein
MAEYAVVDIATKLMDSYETTFGWFAGVIAVGVWQMFHDNGDFDVGGLKMNRRVLTSMIFLFAIYSGLQMMNELYRLFRLVEAAQGPSRVALVTALKDHSWPLNPFRPIDISMQGILDFIGYAINSVVIAGPIFAVVQIAFEANAPVPRTRIVSPRLLAVVAMAIMFLAMGFVMLARWEITDHESPLVPLIASIMVCVIGGEIVKDTWKLRERNAAQAPQALYEIRPSVNGVYEVHRAQAPAADGVG